MARGFNRSIGYSKHAVSGGRGPFAAAGANLEAPAGVGPLHARSEEKHHSWLD